MDLAFLSSISLWPLDKAREESPPRTHLGHRQSRRHQALPLQERIFCLQSRSSSGRQLRSKVKLDWSQEWTDNPDPQLWTRTEAGHPQLGPGGAVETSWCRPTRPFFFLYQDKCLEAPIPDYQEVLWFLLDTLTILEDTQDSPTGVKALKSETLGIAEWNGYLHFQMPESL